MSPTSLPICGLSMVSCRLGGGGLGRSPALGALPGPTQEEGPPVLLAVQSPSAEWTAALEGGLPWFPALPEEALLPRKPAVGPLPQPWGLSAPPCDCSAPAPRRPQECSRGRRSCTGSWTPGVGLLAPAAPEPRPVVAGSQEEAWASGVGSHPQAQALIPQRGFLGVSQ